MYISTYSEKQFPLLFYITNTCCQPSTLFCVTSVHTFIFLNFPFASVIFLWFRPSVITFLQFLPSDCWSDQLTSTDSLCNNHPFSLHVYIAQTAVLLNIYSPTFAPMPYSISCYSACVWVCVQNCIVFMFINTNIHITCKYYMHKYSYSLTELHTVFNQIPSLHKLV